jgi:hypothetical protein
MRPYAINLPMAQKDAGMRIRVEMELRDAFMEACRAQNLHASDVLRDFMRTFTEKNKYGQGILFVDTNQKRD